MKKIILFFLVAVLFSCSSDEIIKSKKSDYFSIYRNLFSVSVPEEVRENPLSKQKMNSKWLSKFNQPIILVSSENGKSQATLVALGNNQEKLTWVSADGISLTLDNGFLIATRGYMQDLMALKHPKLKNNFTKSKMTYDKIHRYLNGENDYDDIRFTCTLSKKVNFNLTILNYNLPTDKFTEKCNSTNHYYENEYYLLPKTKIVLKSKQWISPVNKSLLIYNYYAFQKF